MTASAEFKPTVYWNDGAATASLDGCTLVLPPDEHFANERASMEQVGISFRSDKWAQGPTLDLDRLVQWALAHEYQDDCLTLTLAWHRGEIEESLGRKISDEDSRTAQQWLDETSGGFAAYNVYHALEEVQTELVRRLERLAALNCFGVKGADPRN